MSSKKLAPLKLELSRLKITLDTLVNVQSPDVEVIGRIESAISAYKVLLKEYQDEVRNIIMDLDDDDVEGNEVKKAELIKDLGTRNDSLFKYEGKLKCFYRSISIQQDRDSLLPSGRSSNSSFRDSTSDFAPKLGKLEVPKFDGNILNFANFRALFQNLVHSREDMSNIHKLYYLKEAMVGSAKELLRDFELTESSYPEAWSYLLSRFDNPRAVGKALFRNFRGLTAITSASEVRSLLDKVDVIIRGIKSNVGEINETFSSYIAYHVTCLLDKRSREDFEFAFQMKKLPTFEDLCKFLQNRTFVIEETSYSPRNKEVNESKVKAKSLVATKATVKEPVAQGTTFVKKCLCCSKDHFLDQCEEFLKKSVEDRFLFIKGKKLCHKCFRPGHYVSDCFRQGCRECGGKHHVLIHRYNPKALYGTNEAIKVEVKEPKEPSKPSSSTVLTVGSNKRKYLQTAVVKVVKGRKYVYARVLLDPGSEETLVSRSFLRSGGFPTKRANEIIEIFGINDKDSGSVIDTSAELVLESRFSDFRHVVECGVVSKIPYTLDRCDFADILARLPKLNYGECDLTKSRNVDILIGTEYVEMLMEDNRRQVEGVVLRQSKFGWVLSGAQRSSSVGSKTYCNFSSSHDINLQLRKFWELEEVENVSAANEPEDVEIEREFTSSYTRAADGRFVVRLPLKSTVNQLSGSFDIACRILIRSEMCRTQNLRKAYVEFMEEYQSLNHMTKLSSNRCRGYFIPHHMIQRMTSSTTKFRVVFNASKKDSSGTSLNDHLRVGPVLQLELFDILVKFRRHLVAFCGDIEKMFRQIWVHKEDRKYQRIVWRDDASKEMESFELNTVTYGTACAPYIATKCLQMAAQEIIILHPAAGQSIMEDFYMDDWMTGRDSVVDAIDLQQTVQKGLSAYGFSIRKFQSNVKEFLNLLDDRLVERLKEDRIMGAEYIQVLGLVWIPERDVFRVSILLEPLPSKITKRVILSDISRIFDVLGFLCPVTIRGKLILQDLWREDVDWDQPVSQDLSKQFSGYREELRLLQAYEVPRCYVKKVPEMVQLIGFSDSSLKAYCAVVYFRAVYEDGTVSTQLITSKSRVAPLKSLTIHRLELLAAVLLSKLVKRVSKYLLVSNVYGFTDNSAVLGWIRQPIEDLKQYVRNRVVKILENLKITDWYFVQSEYNPADLGTRGISASKFVNNNLWLNGPDFLNFGFEDVLRIKFNVNSKELTELKRVKVTTLNVTVSTELDLLGRFSNFNKLINVMALILRFIKNFKNNVKSNPNKSIDVIDFEERQLAMQALIRLSQRQSFSKDMSRLVLGKQPKRGSILYSLNPFLNQFKILRVSGRLCNLDISFDEKYPIVISARCKFTRLYIAYLHKKNFHCSKNVVFTELCRKFYVVQGFASVAKGIIRKCVWCCRIQAITTSQIMGQLPKERITVARLFSNVGVDFAGPFQVKCLNHRSMKINEVYVAVFVCFVSRAVHLQLVSDLSTAMFLQCLTRFCARRGKPAKVFSDNGRNFLGASNVLFVERKNISSWCIWKRDYLHTLHSRSKWTKEMPNLRINDVVLIKDEATDSMVWPLAVVTQVFPDSSGAVRNVELRTKTGVFKRPVQKTCSLVTGKGIKILGHNRLLM